MSLTTAFQAAQSSMAVVSAQSNVVSGNIAGVNVSNYARRTANVTTDAAGLATVSSVTRATDQSLYDTMLSTTSASSAASAISDGLNQLQNQITIHVGYLIQMSKMRIVFRKKRMKYQMS